MKIYVMTCEVYYPTLLGFAHLFNKYWGADQQVTVVGYGPLTNATAFPTKPDIADPEAWPLPPNFDFLSLGNQADYPKERWCASLLKMLELIDDDYPIIFFEDYWLIKPVKRNVVETVYNYMRQHTHILKMDLCAERRFAAGTTPFATVSGVNLLKSDPQSPYHMSLWTGIWYRPWLYDLLLPYPNWTAWDVELSGTAVLSQFGDDVLVLGTNLGNDENQQPILPVHHTNVHRAGQGLKYLTDEVPFDDLREMRQLGFIQNR